MAKKLGGHRLSGINPLSYLGVDPSSPSNFVVVTRAPTINDVNHNVGTIWMHDKRDATLTNDIYILVGVYNSLTASTSPQGPAIWIIIGVGLSTLITLTGDGGGPISPDGMGNIDMLGGDLITTTGTGNQITFDLDNGSDGEIIIASTAGSPAYASLASAGGTVTITPGSNTINLEVTSDTYITSPATGTATPVAGVLIFAGTSGVVVSAGTSTVTISSSGTTFLTVTNVNTSPYVVLITDSMISVDASGAPITIQLPNAPSVGQVFYVKDSLGQAATNNITVTTVGGAVLIDGATTFVMNTTYESGTFIFTGTAYEII